MKSKNTAGYILAFLIVLAFLGKATAQTLSLSKSTVQIAATDSSKTTFDITSNSYWGMYTIPSWLKLDTTWGDSNRTMKIIATQNPFTIVRTGSITVYWLKDWEYYSDTKLNVVQSASSEGISDTAIQIGATNGSTASFSITSSMYWEISDLPTWLTVDKNWQQMGKTVTLTATTNPQCLTRTGTFTVKRLLADSTYLTAQVSVTQKASVYGVSVESITIPDTLGSTGKFWVNSNEAWTVSGASSWVSLNKTSSTAVDTIIITAQANTTAYYRVDTITVTFTGGKTFTVVINQSMESVAFSFSPSSFAFDDSLSLSIPVTLKANTNWGFESFPSWIVTSEIIGYGDSTFTLTAQKNTSNTIRTGTFIAYWFDFSNIYHEKKVVVSQTAAPIIKSIDSVSTTSISLADSSGSNASFVITSKGLWTISGLSSWVSSNKTATSGTDTITITSQANTTTSYRLDTVTITFAGGKVSTLIIVQNPKTTFSFSPTSFVFDDSINLSISVTVQSNTNWGFISLPSWITNSQIIGYGDSTFSLTAQKNSSSSTRTDSFTAYWFDYNNVYHENTIIVTQMPEGVIASSSLLQTDGGALVYPNPTKDIFAFVLPSNNILNLSIYTLNGKLVQSITKDFNTIDISNLSAGCYTVIVTTVENKRIEKRLIKQ
jgi:hypothetical protein